MKIILVPTIIALLLMFESPPLIFAASGFHTQYRYAYSRHPDQKAATTDNSVLPAWLKKVVPPWPGNPQAAGNHRQGIDQPAPLIPNETGTEFTLLVGELADRIMSDEGGLRDLTLVVTTFVDLNQLYRTSGLGRLLAEQMMDELRKKGMNVIDVRLSNALQIKEGYGVYGLSREMSELAYVHDAQALLVGTYSVADDQVLVNARLLHQQKGQVLSSGTIILKKNRLVTELLKDENRPVSAPVMIESFDKINSAGEN